MKICLFVLVCALMMCLVTSAQNDPPSDDDSSQNSGVSDVNNIPEVVTHRINVYFTFNPVAPLGLLGLFGIREDGPEPNALLSGEININFFNPQPDGHILAQKFGYITNGVFELIAPEIPLPNFIQSPCYQVIQRLSRARDYEIVQQGDGLGDVID